jgi:hypothetical protein
MDLKIFNLAKNPVTRQQTKSIDFRKKLSLWLPSQLEGAPTSSTSNTPAFNLGFLSASGQKPKDSQLQQQQASPNCVRFQYDGSNSSSGAVDAGSHMFRSTGFRFFNNVVIPLASEEDRVESLKAGLAIKKTTQKTHPK